MAGPVAERAQQIGRGLGRVEDRPGVDRGPERMEVELELRDDAEVAAAAAQPPEQVGVVGLARVDEPAVRRDHVGRREVVAREAELPHRPADAAAEREPGDAGRRDEAARRREAEDVRLAVAGSTRTLLIAERSITIPSSQVEKPATLWPPPRTAIVRSLLRAKPTAAITSAAPVQRTTSVGLRPSCAPFQIVDASA